MAAADTAKLIAQLTLDDKGFNRGLSSAEKGLGKLESTAFRVGQNIGGGLKTAASNIAKIGTIGAIGAAGLLAKSVQEASSLNEQLNKTSAVFGDAAESVKAFSKTTADALGLSQVEALEAAGAYGNMFKTVGLNEKQSAEFSKTLVGLAADMASFNDQDPSEMLDKLRSGLAGEAEPLRQFGVLLSEAEVKAEAYRTGIAKTGEALTEAQKVQARYSLILKQTAVQQGDFAKTSEGMANVTRRLKANLRDAGATIGTALLPKITELAVKLNDLIKDNGPAIQDFANQLPAAFDKAVAFADKIPWETIGKGMEQAAFFTGKLIDAFLSMPPEVQTTLIALAGLNKLSGGAITGIVSELGKGLIKGVLGIQAAHVTVNAASVSGVGGAPAAAGAGRAGLVATGAAAITGAGVILTAEEVASGVQRGFAEALGGSPLDVEIAGKLPSGLNIGGPLDRLVRAFQGDFRSDLEVIQDLERQQIGGVVDLGGKLQGSLREQTERNRQAAFAIRDATAAGAEKNRAAAAAVRDAVNNKVGFLASITDRVRSAVTATTSAAREAGRQTAFAIRDKDLSVSLQNSVTVNTRVSVRETIDTQTTHKQYARYLS